MIKRIVTFTFIALFSLAVPAFAQQTAPTPEELQKKIEQIQQRLDEIQKTTASSDIQELKREIDILTQEIEQLRVEREKPAASATAAPQYGLGPAASKVYRSEPGVSIGGYGEMLYENFDKTADNGTPAGETDRLDMVRAVIYTGFKFNDKILFNSETEVEHASTESGGAVSLEFGYLDFLVRPQFNVRAGLMLVPMGLVNELHEPTTYLGAQRPLVEHDIIPATWGETGVGAFGDAGPVSYRAYVVTGLNAARFSAEGIREGRQAGAEAKAEDFALVGRVDWHLVEGTFVGGSVYSGNSGQGAGYAGKVTLADVHADAKFRGVILRGLWATGRIGDAGAINEANGLEGEESVGKTFGGWYAEAGYDLGAFIPRGEMSLIPYARYEKLNTQESVPAGFLRNPAHDTTVTTIGVAFKPIAQTVIKVDFQNHDNRANSATDQFNVSVGYIF